MLKQFINLFYSKYFLLMVCLFLGLGFSVAQESNVKDSLSDHKAGYKAPLFGDHSSVQGQLEEDDKVDKAAVRLGFLDKGLDKWYVLKKHLNEKHGLQIGLDYNTLYQSASKSLTNEDDAWAGAFRIYGRLALINNNKPHTGFLVFKVENRHALGGKIPPKQLGGQFGYLGVTDVVFSDDGNILGDLNYQQRLGKNDRAAIVIGRFDPNSYMDILGYSNPWTTFSNLSLLLNTSVALHDFSWGIGAGTWFGENENWYVSGSINDANGNIRTNVEWFTGGAEFFKQVEFGWAPDRSKRLFTKANITAWHIDERSNVGAPASYGFIASANKTFNEKWMVFGRAGKSFGDNTSYPFYRTNVMLGVGHELRSYTDRIGLAAHWGEPSNKNLNDEWNIEAFYRLQLTRAVQLTPSAQLILNPANYGSKTSVFVFGLRGRIVL